MKLNPPPPLHCKNNKKQERENNKIAKKKKKEKQLKMVGWQKFTCWILHYENKKDKAQKESKNKNKKFKMWLLQNLIRTRKIKHNKIAKIKK